MMKAQLIAWLQNQEGKMQDVICNAAKDYFKTYEGKPNFIFDINECERESLNLVRGKDLCYDRPSIGFSYSLWYLGRRINTSLTFVIDIVVEAIEIGKPIEIFDMGAGTGAVQMAVGLCLQGAKELGYNLPATKIINIDISPFMLDYHRSHLWLEFVKSFPEASIIQGAYTINSWLK